MASSSFLFIHAAGTPMSVGTYRDGAWQIRETDHRFSAQKIILFLDELLPKQDFLRVHWDALVCCVGPGGFTGIRVAASVIQTLSVLSGAPMIGIQQDESGASSLTRVIDLLPLAEEAFENKAWVLPGEPLPLCLSSHWN